MKVLYAGDSPAGGPANYLLGVLRSMRAEVTHIPPGRKLAPAALRKSHDAVIFSDYGRAQVSQKCEMEIERRVRAGAGFLMVGGWGSFSGPFGLWERSIVESLLPVRCLGRDDRVNFPEGACILPRAASPIFPKAFFSDSPVICGLNAVVPRANAKTLLAVRRIKRRGESLALEKTEYPLLTVSNRLRTAAFATDFAPHWCGGLVDWGRKRRVLPVRGDIRIEVGDKYVAFISSLVRWLAG